MPETSHELRLEKLRSGIRRRSQEGLLLTLLRKGRYESVSPRVPDYLNIVNGINGSEPTILFDWFWTHQNVCEFQEKYLEQIDQEALSNMILETADLVNTPNAKMIERVNMFHLFGVARLFNKVDPRVVSAQNRSLTQGASGLVGVSAQNSALMIRGVGANGAGPTLERLMDKQLNQTFAEYQLFYYGGFNAVLEKLPTYIGTNKEVIVPSTVFSLVTALDLPKAHREFLIESTVSRLSTAARKRLNHFFVSVTNAK